MNGVTHLRCAIVSVCSLARVAHLENQLRAVKNRPDTEAIVAWMDEAGPPAQLPADEVILVPPGAHGLRLAAARNAAAERALERGAELVIFLDADCVPGGELVARYAEAATTHARSILCGPVTYLPPGVTDFGQDSLALRTDPHPARPSPPTGEVVPATAEQYPLFWSLSFALTAQAWRESGGFHEAYEGYGGEDTDFAFAARAAGTPMAWVGGAHAYHQHHPTSSPPWQHLDDILRNGAIFAERWGEWPMRGWLSAFEAAGAIRRVGDGWQRTVPSRHAEIDTPARAAIPDGEVRR